MKTILGIKTESEVEMERIYNLSRTIHMHCEHICEEMDLSNIDSIITWSKELSKRLENLKMIRESIY